MQIDHQYVASVRWSNRQFARVDALHSTWIHFQKCYSTFQELFTGPILTVWKNRRGSSNIIFLDIACAPGGFSQFLLDAFPNCHGFGITLPEHLGGFPVQICDPRFHLAYFDLLTHPIDFSPQMECLADIVIGDAQYFPRNSGDQYGGKMAGTVTGGRLGLLLREFILGFESLNSGGIFIFRFVAWDNIHANILKLFYLCFELFDDAVVPFKSEYQHTADCTFYAVCSGFNRQKYLDLDIDTLLKIAFARVVLSPPFAAVHNGTVNCVQVIKSHSDENNLPVLDKPDAHILENLFPFKTIKEHVYFEKCCDMFTYVYKMFLIGKSSYTDHHPIHTA